MTPDTLNAVFEFGACLFTLLNMRRVAKDKGYAGISIPCVVFFTTWGFWNLFYYPHLGQWWSFTAGAMLVLSNAAWIVAMWIYGRKQ